MTKQFLCWMKGYWSFASKHHNRGVISKMLCSEISLNFTQFTFDVVNTNAIAKILILISFEIVTESLTIYKQGIISWWWYNSYMLCDLLLFFIIGCVLSVNNHSVSDSPFISSSLKRNPHLIEGVSSALNPPASVNSTQTDARSSSYDDITSAPSKVLHGDRC